jgi:antitoxin component of RelBE/YafQ-DinJ toxin-antitoxin module
MPARRTVTFRIDEDLIAGLQAVYARDGASPSEQIRRALTDWLEKKGIAPKPVARRASTRRKTSPRAPVK